MPPVPLLVKTSAGGTFTLDIHGTETIDAIRAMVHQRTGVSPDQLRIVFEAFTEAVTPALTVLKSAEVYTETGSEDNPGDEEPALEAAAQVKPVESAPTQGGCKKNVSFDPNIETQTIATTTVTQDFQDPNQHALRVERERVGKNDPGDWSLVDFMPADETLGKGACSVVRRATNWQTQHVYAMKEINKAELLKRNGKNVARCVNFEVEIQYQLRHPNILRLYDFFEDKHTIYILLEHAEVGSLYQFTKQNGELAADGYTRTRRLSESRAATIWQGTVSGLINIHSAQIMHRDVKPENILLTRDLVPKVADFGFAATTVVASENERLTFCGTKEYIAPEMAMRALKDYLCPKCDAMGYDDAYKNNAPQNGIPELSCPECNAIVRRSPGCDALVDVWATGLLLYELLCGTTPFRMDHDMKLAMKQIVDMKLPLTPPPWHFQYSPEAGNLINALVQKRKHQRLSLHDSLGHEWLRIHTV